MRAKLTLVVAGCVVGLIAAELLPRVLGFWHPPFYRPDPLRGWSSRPSIEGVWDREGHARVKINSEGLRDREHALEHPPQTFRIAVLGDSYAEANQVDQRDAFWSVLERQLGNCDALSGMTPEVISFGVSGHGTAQELLTLQSEVWRFDPDLVLLVFVPTNDFTDNVRKLDLDKARPYYELREGNLDLDVSFRESRTYRALTSSVGSFHYGPAANNLRVIQLAIEARSRWTSRKRKSSVRPQPGWLSEPPRSPEASAAWELTLRLIEEIDHETRRHGKRLVVATVSRGDQVHPDPEAGNRL